MMQAFYPVRHCERLDIAQHMSTEQVIQPKSSLQPRSVEGRFRNIKTGILLLAYVTVFPAAVVALGAGSGAGSGYPV